MEPFWSVDNTVLPPSKVEIIQLIFINHNLFLKQVFFVQTQPKSDVFFINVPVRRLYWSEVCTSLAFVPVRRFYCPIYVTSDVCTGTL